MTKNVIIIAIYLFIWQFEVSLNFCINSVSNNKKALDKTKINIIHFRTMQTPISKKEKKVENKITRKPAPYFLKIFEKNI